LLAADAQLDVRTRPDRIDGADRTVRSCRWCVARTAALALLLVPLVGGCLTERNLDAAPPGVSAPEAPYLVVRRSRGRNKVLVHEWPVLAQKGRDDVRHGRDLSWYPSGAKEWERAFDHGEPKGTWRRWHENGQLASEVEFAGADVERPMRFWHPNGQLSSEGAAKNGVRCGTWRFFGEDGTLREEGEFVESRREGTWKVWSEAEGPTEVTYIRGVRTR
jgi:hypothetical protein